MNHRIFLHLACLAGVLFFTPLSSLSGQTQDSSPGDGKWHPEEIRYMANLLARPVDMKDFRRPMKLKEVLGLIMEKMAARGIDLPILVDTEAFREENESKKVYDTTIRFPSGRKEMTVARFLDEALAQVGPEATFLFRRNYLEVTTSRRACLEPPDSILTYSPPPRKNTPSEGTVIPGGLVDLEAGIVYLTRPHGGIDASELATGKILWTNTAVSRPLALQGNRLLCLSPQTISNTLRLIHLEHLKGKVVLQSEPIVLPSWVSVQGRWGRHLTIEWKKHQGDWLLRWQAKAWWDGPKHGSAPDSLDFREEGGVFGISLKTGRVKALSTDVFSRAKEKSEGARAPPRDKLKKHFPSGWTPLPAGKKTYGLKVKFGPLRLSQRRLIRNQQLVGMDLQTGRVLWSRPLAPHFTGIYPEKLTGWGPGPEEFPGLLRSLTCTDPVIRQTAAEDLGQIGPTARKALPALKEALRDSDGLVRLNVAEALLRIDPKQLHALKSLAATLQSPDPVLRARAAETLGLFAELSRPAIGDLCTALRADKDPLVRGMAAIALGRIKSEPNCSVPALASALKDPDTGVRFWAAGALFRFGRHTRIALPALREELKTPDDFVRQSALLCVRWLGNEGVDALCGALRDKTLPERVQFAEMLKEMMFKDIRIANKISFPTLYPFLWDSDRAVRSQTAWALRNMDPERGTGPAVEVFCQLVWQNDWEEGTSDFDSYAIFSLGCMGPAGRKGVPLLCQAMKIKSTDDISPRLEAAKALGRIGPAALAAIPQLKKALEDETIPPVRIQAALALWKITGEAEYLLKLLKDYPQEIAAAIGELGSQGKAAAGHLKKFLGNNNSDALSFAAAKSLLQIGSHQQEALGTMIAFLKNRGVGPRDSWSREDVRRETAIEELAKIGPDAKAALPMLETLLKNEAPSLRLSAAFALCKIGGRPAIAVPMLARGLENESVESCVTAARYLGDLGPRARAAVPALLRALDQDDFELYLAAISALNAIDKEAAAKAGVQFQLPPRKPLTRPQIASLWRDLTSDNLQKAYLAQWRLTETPGQAVAGLEEYFPPVESVSAVRLGRLLEDLKSNQFRIRQKAHQELSQLGELAEPVLRQTLVKPPSLEFSRRLQKLLDALQPTSPRFQRLVRTIQVLEFHHTPEAKKLLEKLAAGNPQAWRTQEAWRALERIKENRK